jgi:hypothetical protein
LLTTLSTSSTRFGLSRLVVALQQNSTHRRKGLDKTHSTHLCAPGTVRKHSQSMKCSKDLGAAAVLLCIHDVHSTQQCAAAAGRAPQSRPCCGLSSALLHSTNSSDTLPEQQIMLKAIVPKSACLAFTARSHCRSALQQRSLHRCKALDELFPTRSSAPKLVGKKWQSNERHLRYSWCARCFWTAHYVAP